MEITDRAVNEIRHNNRAIGMLMCEFNKGHWTIINWLDAKDVRLITPMAINIIKEYTGLHENEIVGTPSVGRMSAAV